MKFIAWLKRLFGIKDAAPEPVPAPMPAPIPDPDPIIKVPVGTPLIINLGPIRKTGGPLLVPKKPHAVKGFDISHYQPRVNWENVVREGFRFGFAKASDGTGTKDVMFDNHRRAAAAKGIPLGPYHYVRFGGTDGKAEADLFLKYTGPARAGELPHVIDVEWDKKNPRYDEESMDEDAANEAFEIASRVRDATKTNVIIYTSYPFFRNFKKPERFFDFLLWCPAYAEGLAGPKVPLPWSGWAFWQYTDKYEAAKSITGDNKMDANWFNGTNDELKLLVNK